MKPRKQLAIFAQIERLGPRRTLLPGIRICSIHSDFLDARHIDNLTVVYDDGGIANDQVLWNNKRTLMTNSVARLNTIFASIFGDAASSLSENDGIATVAAWDSASQLDLIMAIEAEFDVYFDIAELSELTNVGAIRNRLLQLQA